MIPQETPPESQKRLVRVKFNEGITVSGKFQSWRVDLGMEMDCFEGEETEVYEALKGSVEQKLVDTVKENKDSIAVLISVAKKKLEENID